MLFQAWCCVAYAYPGLRASLRPHLALNEALRSFKMPVDEPAAAGGAREHDLRAFPSSLSL